MVCQWMWVTHENYCTLSSIFFEDIIVSHKCFWTYWPAISLVCFVSRLQRCQQVALEAVVSVVKSVLFCIFFGSKSVLFFVVFLPSNYLKIVWYINEILKNMEHSQMCIPSCYSLPPHLVVAVRSTEDDVWLDIEVKW